MATVQMLFSFCFMWLFLPPLITMIEDACLDSASAFDAELLKASTDDKECIGTLDISSSSISRTTESNKTIYSQDPITLEASISLQGNCRESHQVQWLWTGKNVTGAQLSLNGIAQTNSSYLQLPPHFLTIGAYEFVAEATLVNPIEYRSLKFAENILKVSDKFPVEVIPADIIVMLKGDSERMVMYEEGTFTLNAGGTYDPENKLNINDIMFAYSCDVLSSHLNEKLNLTASKHKRQINDTTAITMATTAQMTTIANAIISDMPTTAIVEATVPQLMTVMNSTTTDMPTTTVGAETVPQMTTIEKAPTTAIVTATVPQLMTVVNASTTNMPTTTVGAETVPQMTTIVKAPPTTAIVAATVPQLITVVNDTTTNMPTAAVGAETVPQMTAIVNTTTTNMFTTAVGAETAPRNITCRGLLKPFKYTHNASLTLKVSSFPLPEDYVFRVYAIPPVGMRKPVFKQQIIHFVHYQLKNYEIRCLHNCDPTVNPYDEIRLNAACTDCGPKERMQWRLEALDDQRTSEPFSINWGFDSKYGQGHQRLVIRPGVLNPFNGTSIRFSIYSDDGKLMVSKVVPMVKNLQGNCSAVPDDGWELTTEFQLSCSFFGNDLPPTAHFEYRQQVKGRIARVKANDIILDYSYSNPVSAVKVRLLAGNPRMNYRTTIWVTLIESSMFNTSIPIVVMVRPLCNELECKRLRMECLTKLTTVGLKGNSLTSSMELGQYRTVIGTSHVVAHMLNRLQMQELPIDARAKARLSLLQVANSSSLLTLPSIRQVIYLVGTIFHGEYAGEILEETRITALDILSKSIATTEILASNSTETPFMLKQLTTKIAEALSDVFMSYSKEQIKPIPPDKMPMPRLEEILHSATRILLNPEHITDEVTKIDTDYFSLLVQITNSNNLRNMTFGYIPSEPEMEQFAYFRVQGDIRRDKVPFQGDVSVEFIQFKKNVMNVDSPTLERYILPAFLFIHDKATGRLITKELGPIDFYLPMRDASINSVPFKGMFVDKEDIKSDSDIAIHQVNLPQSHQTLTIMLSVSLLSTHSLQIVIKNSDPVMEDFRSGDAHILSADNKNTMRREDVEFASVTPRQSKNVLLVGLIPTRSTSRNVIKEFSNTGVRPFFLYSPDLVVLECLHWDTDRNTWSNDDCHVVENESTSPNMLQCRCTSLSRFSGRAERLQMSGQQLDRFDFYLSVPFNVFIIMFLFVLLIIFIVLFVFSLLIDSWYSYNFGVTFVEDNDPKCTHGYLISVTTGHQIAAGTSSLVAVQLHGEDGDSEIHALIDTTRLLHRMATVDHFLITTQASIGNIRAMTLIRKAVAPHQSWFLTRIIVSSLMGNNEWEFYVNKRLECESVNPVYNNFKGKRVPENQQDKIVSVKERIVRRFGDEFIWIGFIYRSTTSPFSSSQRIICMVFLVLMDFMINLILRGLPEHTPVQHIGVYGFQIIMEDIILGFVTSIILFLLTIFLIFLLKSYFMNIKWKVYIDLRKGWNKYHGGLAEGGQSHGVKKREQVEGRESTLAFKQLFVTIDKAKVYELEMQPIAGTSEAKVATKAEEGPSPSAKDDDTSDELSSGYPESKQRSCPWYCYGRNMIWIALFVVNILLFILLYVLGHWYSEAQTKLWIFSSLIGLFVCVLVLHPIFVIIIAMILPLRRDTDKLAIHEIGLTKIYDERNERIHEEGTLDEYHQYLCFIRQNLPIYQSNKKDMAINFRQKQF